MNLDLIAGRDQGLAPFVLGGEDPEPAPRREPWERNDPFVMKPHSMAFPPTAEQRAAVQRGNFAAAASRGEITAAGGSFTCCSDCATRAPAECCDDCPRRPGYHVAETHIPAPTTIRLPSGEVLTGDAMRDYVSARDGASLEAGRPLRSRLWRRLLRRKVTP